MKSLPNPSDPLSWSVSNQAFATLDAAYPIKFSSFETVLFNPLPTILIVLVLEPACDEFSQLRDDYEIEKNCRSHAETFAASVCCLMLFSNTFFGEISYIYIYICIYYIYIYIYIYI